MMNIPFCSESFGQMCLACVASIPGRLLVGIIITNPVLSDTFTQQGEHITYTQNILCDSYDESKLAISWSLHASLCKYVVPDRVCVHKLIIPWDAYMQKIVCTIRPRHASVLHCWRLL